MVDSCVSPCHVSRGGCLTVYISDLSCVPPFYYGGRSWSFQYNYVCAVYLVPLTHVPAGLLGLLAPDRSYMWLQIKHLSHEDWVSIAA